MRLSLSRLPGARMRPAAVLAALATAQALLAPVTRLHRIPPLHSQWDGNSNDNDWSSEPPSFSDWASASDEDAQGDLSMDALAETILSPEADFIESQERVQQLRLERNLTDQQLATFLNLDLESVVDADVASDKAMERFQEVTASGDVAFGQAVELGTRLGIADSHELVELDDNGEPMYERFVYVDEHACIGCTNCACVARATFFMEDEHGRARVFQQNGDSEEIIEEAIDTCPVNCIHYVPWKELISLEVQRRGQVINNKARLVNQQEGKGGDVSHLVGGMLRKAMAQDISGNRGMRCSDCPGRGCKSCPMYGVGENPAYLTREMKKKAKRAKKAAAKDPSQVFPDSAEF